MKRAVLITSLSIAAVLHFNAMDAVAQKKKEEKPAPPVSYDNKSGHFEYAPDSLGNRIPDFSYCGYAASEEPLPIVPVKVKVPAKAGDATTRIQAAIDYVSSLAPDKNGFRGAVLLGEGTHLVEGSLVIKSSGVVIRGAGVGNNRTVLVGTGVSRETLIKIAGVNNKTNSSEITITDAYVPVNALSFHVAANAGIKAGDHITIRRPCTQAWINALGTAHFGGGITSLGWKPGQREIFWDRKVLSVVNGLVTIDAPITTALDSTYGGGFISKYNWTGQIERCGIENLQLVSTFDKSNLKDEDHRWMATSIENATDSWVRQVQFEHFAGSAVMVLETARRITIEDCKSLQPVSEIGGERRNTFMIFGQQCLVQRCYAEYGIHDFALGFCAAGPNAFVQCRSYLPYSFSGGIDSWSSGVLFDVMVSDGNTLSFFNRGQDGQGAGWNTANSLFWNSSAARIDCYKPPTAYNWSYASWSQFSGDGYWAESNNWIHPISFYYAQLKDRIGDKKWASEQVVISNTEATSSPTVEQAMKATAEAAKPLPQLQDIIDLAYQRFPISTGDGSAKTIDEIGVPVKKPVVRQPAMQIKNGWIVRADAVQTGLRREINYWNGTFRRYAIPETKPHITRYVPGRSGTGLTDDLDSMTSWMKTMNWIGIDHHYGLWYERRRDDHERIRRMDGDVWPPFYELPFARTGQGTAWDGLSKYDLTKYNSFYWNRLKQYADLADEKGLVLLHQNYFQHNIIEAGAHYADFPWRSANNINETGFPEPVPYAGDKRIFMAEQFYDVSNEHRKALHRAYIRKCLDNFKDNNGVIQLIGEEFTGPLHFVQFWIDVISEWEKETGLRPLVALSTTKDVQDAILADPARAAVVDIIDIRYWYYQLDGSAYAPLGGQNLAPRQHARQLKPKATSFEQVYRAVKEYRDKFPGKAVMYSSDRMDESAWASFMASGSLASIPRIDNIQFYNDASTLHPVTFAENQYTLDGKDALIIYSPSGKAQIDLSGKSGKFEVRWINAANGAISTTTSSVKAGKQINLSSPGNGYQVLWLSRK